MNYIKRLEKEIGERDAELKAYVETIQNLMRYLCSDKFREDTTVQVGDVLHRIRENLHTYRSSGF